MELEEMTTVNGLMMVIRGIKDILNGIDCDTALDAAESEELYIEGSELFTKLIKAMLRYKVLLLWSEPDSVSVHVLNTDKECEMWKANAEQLFEEYPIPDSDNHELDEFARNNRFVCEISFEQFCELAGDELANPDNYSISECGLEYIFEDRTAVINARAEGKL